MSVAYLPPVDKDGRIKAENFEQLVNSHTCSKHSHSDGVPTACSRDFEAQQRLLRKQLLDVKEATSQ